MVDLVRQYEKIKQDIDKGIDEVIQSTQFINGSATKKLASDLASYNGSGHCLPCANGTDALQIALMALDMQPGDEVITVPFTFVATVEVVALLGFKPIFVDIEPDTFNMDVAAIEAAITPKTKCIIPVHLFGQASNMDAIMAIAEKHNITVIEDNAQAMGCDYTGKDGKPRKTGSIGHIGTTSFYPTKNLGGYGDSGAIFTDDENLASRIRKITNHGSDKKYYYDSIGVNSRLDSMQAAILNAKLPHLDNYNRQRRQSADYYDQLLKDIPGITIPFRSPESSHVFHQYTIKVEKGRDALQEFLKKKEIPSMIYYPVPLHLSSAYGYYGYSQGDFPRSEKAAEQVLSLPMHTELDAEQIEYIVDAIKSFQTYQ